MTDMMMIMIKHSRLVGKDGDSENEHLMMMSFDKSRSSDNSFIVLFRKMILFQFPSSPGGGPLARSKFWSHCTENSSKELSLLRILVNLSNPLNWQLTNDTVSSIQSWTQAVLFVYGSTFYDHYNLQISQNKAIIIWTLPQCYIWHFPECSSWLTWKSLTRTLWNCSRNYFKLLIIIIIGLLEIVAEIIWNS